ncbi:MAG: P-type conjugative transfer protein TrbJ [Sedimenticola sp.]
MKTVRAFFFVLLMSAQSAIRGGAASIPGEAAIEATLVAIEATLAAMETNVAFISAELGEISAAQIAAAAQRELLHDAEMIQQELISDREMTQQQILSERELRRLDRQVDLQDRMYDNMQFNTRTLNRHTWGRVREQLVALAEASRTGNAIAYAADNLERLFSDRYRNYQGYLANTKGASAPANFRRDYRNWYNTQRDGIDGALRAANLQYKQFSSEERTLNTLQGLSETAQGRMKALQVGHQIAMQQVRQTQKLRALVMAQMQMQSNYLASEAAKEAANQAKAENFFTHDGETTLGNEKRWNPASENLSGASY